VSLALPVVVAAWLAVTDRGSGPVSPVPRWRQSASPPARPSPSPVTTLLADARRALSAGDLDAASHHAEACVARAAGDVRCHLLLGRVRAAAGRWHDAYEPLRRASTLAPNDADVLYFLGLVTARLAQIELERVFTVDPDSPRVHQLLAEALEAQERRAEAEAEYELALAARPDLIEALLPLARLKRGRLDCEGAIALYTRAERVRPTFEAAHGLGRCHLQRGEHALARERFRQAVARDPKAALAWVGLGSVELHAGNPGEAIAPLQRAIALEPRLGEAYYLLGRAHQQQGDQVRAQEAFATAERLRTSAPGGEPRER
jgi:predicted Zn-dependent protease